MLCPAIFCDECGDFIRKADMSNEFVRRIRSEYSEKAKMWFPKREQDLCDNCKSRRHRAVYVGDSPGRYRTRFDDDEEITKEIFVPGRRPTGKKDDMSRT